MNSIIGIVMIIGTLFNYNVPLVELQDTENTVIVDFNDGEIVEVIDEITYDLKLSHVFVVVPIELNCIKDSDRMFSDRFQKELKVQINDGEAVVLERFEYHTGIGVVEIDTRDPLVCEEL